MKLSIFVDLESKIYSSTRFQVMVVQMIHIADS